MLYKINTTKELEDIKTSLPESVRQEAKRIVKILDESYSSHNQCGGYLHIGTGKRDFSAIQRKYPKLLIEDYEFLDMLQGRAQEKYVSILYILSADYTLSIIVPEEALPSGIWEEIAVRNNGSETIGQGKQRKNLYINKNQFIVPIEN